MWFGGLYSSPSSRGLNKVVILGGLEKGNSRDCVQIFKLDHAAEGALFSCNIGINKEAMGFSLLLDISHRSFGCNFGINEEAVGFSLLE